MSASGKRLYVGNFPYSTTEDELRRAFSDYGGAGEIKIIMDRDTGRSKGFAFVEMLDGASVQVAIAGLNGKDFGGRDLRVALAVDRR